MIGGEGEEKDQQLAQERIKPSDKYYSATHNVAHWVLCVPCLYGQRVSGGLTVDNRLNINYGDYAAFSLQMSCLIVCRSAIDGRGSFHE